MNQGKMESELGFLVSVVIICADITATVLGIEAEIAQSKVLFIIRVNVVYFHY